MDFLFATDSDIHWDMKQTAGGTIEVYAVDGRHVATLARDIPANGTVRFKGRDQAGRLLPSGTYLFTFIDRTGGIVDTRKASLVR